MKKTKTQKATHEGEMRIGDLSIPCAVLQDGSRVLTQREFLRAIGRTGSIGTGSRAKSGGDHLPSFLSSNSLKPYVEKELTVTSTPIKFIPLHGGKAAYGYKGELLTDVCKIYLMARSDNALPANQLHIAAKCEILLRGFASVGVIALIDEATGYQEIRDKEALQALLDRYLAKELAAWAKKFPDEFYKQIFRLRGWVWRGMSVNRPSYVGKLTNDIIYNRLAPGILEELKARTPKNQRFHQWLSVDVGNPALSQHLHAVIALMRISSSWRGFYSNLQRAFPKKSGEQLLIQEENNS